MSLYFGLHCEYESWKSSRSISRRVRRSDSRIAYRSSSTSMVFSIAVVLLPVPACPIRAHFIQWISSILNISGTNIWIEISTNFHICIACSYLVWVELFSVCSRMFRWSVLWLNLDPWGMTYPCDALLKSGKCENYDDHYYRVSRVYAFALIRMLVSTQIFRAD